MRHATIWLPLIVENPLAAASLDQYKGMHIAQRAIIIIIMIIIILWLLSCRSNLRTVAVLRDARGAIGQRKRKPCSLVIFISVPEWVLNYLKKKWKGIWNESSSPNVLFIVIHGSPSFSNTYCCFTQYLMLDIPSDNIYHVMFQYVTITDSCSWVSRNEVFILCISSLTD